MKTYYHGLDEMQKDCLIARIGDDNFEIIHECNRGYIISNYSIDMAIAAGFRTVRVAGKQVIAKEATVNRYKGKVKAREYKLSLGLANLPIKKVA